MRNQTVQKRLLVKADLDFAKALEIAEMEEMAIKDASELQLQAKPEPVHHIEKSARTTNGMRSKDQLTDMSRPKEIRCWVCGKSGHIARRCRNKGKVQRRPFQQSRNSREAHAISEESESQSDSEVTGHINVVNWLRVDLLRKTRENKPMLITVAMEGKGLEMEVDTGAAVSILPYREYERSFNHLALKPSRVKLKTYSGERITPKGELTMDAKIKGRIYPLIVVDSPGPPLLGRDWMRVVNIEWRDINHMELKQEQKAEMEERLRRLKEHYSSVFEDCLGKLVGMKARLTLKPDATPRFVKAKPVPYTMRPKIEKELEKLQQMGVLSPVTWSEWATPIVAVQKPDGGVRLCGDYKVTVNPEIQVERYPLPRIEDIFATMNGGSVFSKIDLKLAYLQMEVEDECRKLLTINTHKGLYQFNRLPFGVASAPAIWQRTMEQVLQGIPHTQCMLDDILVAGGQDHLEIVEMVLQRLNKYGLKANLKKCEFLKDSLEFCGHKIDKDGLHKMKTKTEAVMSAPRPENVSQLRAFLRLVNYYHTFLPNLATKLQALYHLLKKGVQWLWTDEVDKAFNTANGWSLQIKSLHTSKQMFP